MSLHDQTSFTRGSASEPFITLPWLPGGDPATSIPPDFGQPVGPAQSDCFGTPLGTGQSGETVTAAANVPAAAVTVLPAVTALPGLEPGGSLQSVLQCRTDQVLKYGHTLASDAERPLKSFVEVLDMRAAEIHRLSHAAREDHQFNMKLDQIRKRLVKLAAMTLATIDRIDVELAGDLDGDADGEWVL